MDRFDSQRGGVGKHRFDNLHFFAKTGEESIKNITGHTLMSDQVARVLLALAFGLLCQCGCNSRSANSAAATRTVSPEETDYRNFEDDRANDWGSTRWQLIETEADGKVEKPDFSKQIHLGHVLASGSVYLEGQQYDMRIKTEWHRPGCDPDFSLSAEYVLKLDASVIPKRFDLFVWDPDKNPNIGELKVSGYYELDGETLKVLTRPLLAKPDVLPTLRGERLFTQQGDGNELFVFKKCSSRGIVWLKCE